jgi:dGTPase
VFDSSIRQRLEDAENNLSVFAARSKYSKGRAIEEEPSPIRTAYQRDRDRILYSNAFQRLKHKTQVFIAPLGDHYVTRLTHTLEVAQMPGPLPEHWLNEDQSRRLLWGTI